MPHGTVTLFAPLKCRKDQSSHHCIKRHWFLQNFEPHFIGRICLATLLPVLFSIAFSIYLFIALLTILFVERLHTRAAIFIQTNKYYCLEFEIGILMLDVLRTAIGSVYVSSADYIKSLSSIILKLSSE